MKTKINKNNHNCHSLTNGVTLACHSLTNGATSTCHSLSKFYLRNKESQYKMPYLANAQGMTMESGRSMVEMLGVLAIIGVLSVGGIAGYTMAMNKHKANELLNEASKRAVVVSGHILLGKAGSIAEFTDPSGYKFEYAAVEGQNQFKLTLKTSAGAKIDESICAQIKNVVGGEHINPSVNDNCTEFTYNTDLGDGASSEKKCSTNEECTNPCQECGSEGYCKSTCGEGQECHTDNTTCVCKEGYEDENGICKKIPCSETNPINCTKEECVDQYGYLFTWCNWAQRCYDALEGEKCREDCLAKGDRWTFYTIDADEKVVFNRAWDPNARCVELDEARCPPEEIEPSLSNCMIFNSRFGIYTNTTCTFIDPQKCVPTLVYQSREPEIDTSTYPIYCYKSEQDCNTVHWDGWTAVCEMKNGRCEPTCMGTDYDWDTKTCNKPIMVGTDGFVHYVS